MMAYVWGYRKTWVIYNLKISPNHTSYSLLDNHLLFWHTSSEIWIPGNYNELQICLPCYTASFQSMYWSRNCLYPYCWSQGLLYKNHKWVTAYRKDLCPCDDLMCETYLQQIPNLCPSVKQPDYSFARKLNGFWKLGSFNFVHVSTLWKLVCKCNLNQIWKYYIFLM